MRLSGGRAWLLGVVTSGLLSGCAGFADWVGLKESDIEGRSLPHPEVVEKGNWCGAPRAGVGVRHETAQTVRLKVSVGLRRSGGYRYRLATPALVHDREAGKVTVRIRERAPEPDRTVVAAVTRPCLILRADMWPDPERVELEILEEERVYDHQPPEFHPAR